FVLVYTGQDRWNSVEGTFTVGGGGSSSPSPTAPAAPTNLKITSLTASCVSKAWNASSDSSIAGYRVYRSTKSGSGYTLINSSLCKEPKYEDTNVAPGSTYYYTVTAVNTSGQESPKSNEVQAKVPSSSGGTNHPPSANSGGNQTVGSGATVILAGSATDPDGDALTYLWRQVGGSSISLSGANTPTASFRAPVVTKELKLVFDFVVSDGRGGTDSDRMAVYVKPGLSSTNNNPPTANAGPDLTTSPGAKVTLSGAGSDPDGNPLSFSWTQVSGPGVALSASGATATFTAPAVSADTTLVFRLTVNDGKGGSGSDDVKVLVKTKSSGVNQPPVAIPGPNQTVTSGAKVTLSGAGSYDPDGDPITYVQWKQISGPTVKLSSTSSLVTSFVAPKVTRKMEVILRLGIKDSHGAGDDDRVSVFIMP
ncbi:MAG TPA: fibronectin type III domain-containing protein, partial [Acidobacteriota bacterium]|nr:fibronectin type III domain-containing protein [Acidobacteriota bacterium]